MMERYLFIMLLFLSGCASTKINSCPTNTCPPCAIAGPKVAKELAKVCDEKTCPNTIDWINRHAKVCDILNSRNKI